MVAGIYCMPSVTSLFRTCQVQAALPLILGGYLGLALHTTAWQIEGEDNLAPHAAGNPAIFAFWHEFLPLMPALLKLAHRLPSYQEVPIHTLVSQHRDGRVIGNIVSRFGISPVMGSSTRGGVTALRKLAAVLRQGSHIGIAPDGPTGPPRHAAPGVAHLAALSGIPVLPCAARTSRRIKLGTWDNMPIPLPFNRGVMVCGSPVSVPRNGWREFVPTIEHALNEVAGRADVLCRG